MGCPCIRSFGAHSLGRCRIVLGLSLWFAFAESCAHADFDLQLTLVNASSLSKVRRPLLETALDQAEAMWEHVITGYQGEIDIESVQIDVRPTIFLGDALGSGGHTSTTIMGGYTLATRGEILLNISRVEEYSDWQGPGANGLNFLDELIAHEIGHVLGIGLLWTENGVYFDDFQYVGELALAAYQSEFDTTATFVPVESAGGASSHAHWDQMFRSSAEEGDPSDPWSLSPLSNVVDTYGRDFSFELMTSAMDPDFGEPFLSRTTVESLRDLGYTVTSFEDFNGDGVLDAGDLAIWSAGFGSTGLQIDSIRRGDANRDRIVEGGDFLQWQRAGRSEALLLVVPEPRSVWLLALLAAGAAVRRSGPT